MSNRWKRVRIVHVMAQANFESWIHSPRTWIMLLFVTAFCYVVCHNHEQMVQELGVHWGETMFYILYNGCNITMTSILFLVTISEIPRRMGYQYNMLIRSTRNQWLCSQLLYCLWMTLTMILLVIVCAGIFILPGITLGGGWTDDLRIASGIMMEENALVPTFIRQNFTPLTACLYALLPTFFFWFSMVCIVLLFSLFGVPLVGLLFYALMLVGNVVFMVEMIGNIPMPIYYATLSNITIGCSGKEFTKYNQAMIGYGAVLSTILIVMFFRVRKNDLEFDFAEHF